MRDWLLTVALLPTLAASLVAQQNTRAMRAPDFAEVRGHIRELMAKDSVPGLAIAVVRDGRIIWEEGFGLADKDRRLPATADTPFLLASLAKTFVATAALVLQGRHQLQLDAPANDYLPNAKLWSPVWDTKDVTLRRLLTHTAGVTTFDLGCAPLHMQCSLPSAEEIIGQYGVVVWPPGRGFDYSNLGYFIVDEAMTHAAKKSLGRILAEELFQPLGMKHTSLAADRALADVSATAYRWVGPAVRRSESRDTLGYASGSMYSSAHDLAMFGAYELGTPMSGQKSVLSDSLRTAAHREAIAANDVGTGYGLGWWIEANRMGVRSLLAQGGNDRTSAWLRLIPSERIAVALVANRGLGWTEGIVDEAIGALVPVYGDSVRARAQKTAASSNSNNTPTAITVDSSYTGAWAGAIRTRDGEIPISVTIAADGQINGRLGTRDVSGRARVDRESMRIAIPGDLEGPPAAGDQRRVMFYLERRGNEYWGAVTTAPAVKTDLIGLLSYWVSLTKK